MVDQGFRWTRELVGPGMNWVIGCQEKQALIIASLYFV